ncbi:MAG TPA: hypothetical protein VK741_25625 [Acetobacteraceae bacterium]|jgi:hypothetical protein|nr:hypothetical protein [Acetobacteraceae bacterium]
MYNAMNWYWAVGGSTTQVWSSQRVAYVPVTDATYLAWLATGNVPTQIASAAALGQVIMAQWLPAFLTAGVAVASTGTPALDGTYPLDQVSQNQITGISAGVAAGKGLPGGGSTFFWQDVTGAPHAFTAAAFTDFASALESYVYNYTQALGAIIAGGSASFPTLPLTIA